MHFKLGSYFTVLILFGSVLLLMNFLERQLCVCASEEVCSVMLVLQRGYGGDGLFEVSLYGDVIERMVI